VTLLSKAATKLRVKPHLRGAYMGSKWMRWIKVLIVGIYSLKWSRRVALSFLGARRGRSLIWVKCFLHLLHILLQLLVAISLFMKPCLNRLVRATHVKQDLKHLLDGSGRFFTLLSRRLPLVTPVGLTGGPYRSNRFCCCRLLLR
jgi:hypothetical protein